MDLPLDIDQLTAPPQLDEPPLSPLAAANSPAVPRFSPIPPSSSAAHADKVQSPTEEGDGYQFPALDENDEHLAIEDLFGDLFEVEDHRPVDPALVDTRRMLLRFFGDHVREEDVDFEDEKHVKLAKEMADNKAAARFAAAEKCFGEAGAASLEDQRVEPFGCLQSSLPDAPDLGPRDELWLTDMPKIAPNRQTLHMEPQPFIPSKCMPLNSTERMLFTTQNVVRWAYHKGTNTFMSNARIVRWSDGSVTLHVGSDLFTLQSSKENTVTMLARPVVVQKGAVGVPAMVSAVNPTKHLVVEGATAASVEEAVIAESARFRSVSKQHNLAYSTPTLPNINWKKMTKARTPIEEYVMKEYDRRQKLIEQRKKEGRPMTLTEQMEMEDELLQKLKTISAEELLEQQEEKQREAVLRSTVRPQQLSRGRFNRNTNLEGGADMAVANDGSDGIWKGYEEQEDGDDDTYETTLEIMRTKRQRENDADNAERLRRIHQRENEQVTRYKPLMEALRGLLPCLPSGSNALGAVQGTLDFLETGAFSAGVVEKEVPLMMEEVADECPDIDLSAVRNELRKLFP
ncbi:putative RNA polymerase-associated protein LEO1 [Trypanosoma cruzi]|nr:putative RNA polymerase-associated protein LEO1 [Trypanosoma cruzi]